MTQRNRNIAMRRLKRDLIELQRANISSIAAQPLDNNIFEWHVNIKPTDGAYSGVYFHLIMLFPQTYPSDPPRVKICTSIKHPNIFGEWLCIDMLRAHGETTGPYAAWSNSYSATSILMQLQSFLYADKIDQYGGYQIRAYLSKHDISRSIKICKEFICRTCSHSHDSPWPNHNGALPKSMIANFGTRRDIESYPAKSGLDGKIAKRLSDIFGKPYRNKLLSRSNDNQWISNCSVSHSKIEWTSYSNDHQDFVTEEIVGRGFAINQRTGWIATVSINYINVFEPVGLCEYRLRARYQFTAEQKLKGEDELNSRIRFVGESIFVWSFTKSQIYSFKISNNSIKLVNIIKDPYFKESRTMDVVITDNLLIILFDRWLGVYKLRPRFEWYHAIAFSTKEQVNSFSIETCHYDEENDKNAFYRSTIKNYMFINAQNQLIGIHPANPTFEYLHIAEEVQHVKCKYCISKRYGTFHISNDGKQLFQSPHLDHKTTQKLIDLNECELGEIDKFCNLRYDETYGTSGRLLLLCQTKSSQNIIHQLFHQNELNGSSKEFQNLEHALKSGGDDIDGCDDNDCKDVAVDVHNGNFTWHNHGVIDELWVWIFECLEVPEIFSAQFACKRWYGLINKYNIMERNEISCYYTKAKLGQAKGGAILGIGLTLKPRQNGYGGYDFNSQMDILSLSAWQNGCKIGVWGETLTHFLPLVINKEHAKIADIAIHQYLGKIKMTLDSTDKGYSNKNPNKFDNIINSNKMLQVIDTLITMMNQIVVQFVMNNQNTNINSVSMVMCEKVVLGYCALHHLLLYLVSKNKSTISNFANLKVSSFRESKDGRNKSMCKDLGKFLIYLMISTQYSWSDVGPNFIKEVFTRNVRWMVQDQRYKKYDTTNFVNGRLKDTFNASKISRRLVMFQVWFMRKNANETLKDYNQRLGRPTAHIKRAIVGKTKYILGCKSWRCYFDELDVIIKDNNAIDQLLRFAIYNSKKNGYHYQRHNYHDRYNRYPQQQSLPINQTKAPRIAIKGVKAKKAAPRKFVPVRASYGIKSEQSGSRSVSSFKWGTQRNKKLTQSPLQQQPAHGRGRRFTPRGPSQNQNQNKNQRATPIRPRPQPAQTPPEQNILNKNHNQVQNQRQQHQQQRVTPTQVSNVPLCSYYRSAAGCAIGQRCNYLHENNVPFCEYYQTPQGCALGNLCNYRH